MFSSNLAGLVAMVPIVHFKGSNHILIRENNQSELIQVCWYYDCSSISEKTFQVSTKYHVTSISDRL